MYKKEEHVLNEDRRAFAEAFCDKVLLTSKKGTGTSIRECLIRSVYANVFQDNKAHPCFNMTDKQWVDKWKDLSLYLPQVKRRKKRPTFEQFVEDLRSVYTQDNRSLRIGQVLVSVSGNANCPALFYLESCFFRTGWL